MGRILAPLIAVGLPVSILVWASYTYSQNNPPPSIITVPGQCVRLAPKLIGAVESNQLTKDEAVAIYNRCIQKYSETTEV